MTSSFLRYRVGHRARRRLLQHGLKSSQVAALVGPASGPKWLALSGLDRALLDSGLLTPRAGGPAIQLLGASAGAWRMLAYATRRPQAALRRLEEGYIGQVFSRRDKAPYVSDCYRRLMRSIVDGDPRQVLDNPRFDLAILTCRLRGVRSRPAMAASLLTAAALHLATPKATDWLFERVLFHSRPERASSLQRVTVAALDADNVMEATLASGTVPFYLQSIHDLMGAPAGAYIDGGLTDYHLNPASMQPWDGIVLLPHYWRRVVPRWLDKGRPGRDLDGRQAADVLQIYPSQEFTASLPGGRLPDREDFKIFVDAPEERQRRWLEVTRRSEQLGDELRADLASGDWRGKLEAW